MIHNRFFTTSVSTDFEALKELCDNITWTFNDLKVIGYALMRNASPSAPTAIPSTMPIRQVERLSIGNSVMLLSGTVVAEEGGDPVPALAIVGAYGSGVSYSDGVYSVSEQFATNATRLANLLGYNGHWFVAINAEYANLDDNNRAYTQGRIASLGTDGQLTTVFQTGWMGYYHLAAPYGYDKSVYVADVPTDSVIVDDMHVLRSYNVALSAYIICTEQNYETDLQNVADITRLFNAALGTPAETTDLTPRVASLESELATVSASLDGNGVGSVNARIAAATAPTIAATAALADALDNIPVFGSTVKQVAQDAANVRQYIPRA